MHLLIESWVENLPQVAMTSAFLISESQQKYGKLLTIASNSVAQYTGGNFMLLCILAFLHSCFLLHSCFRMSVFLHSSSCILAYAFLLLLSCFCSLTSAFLLLLSCLCFSVILHSVFQLPAATADQTRFSVIANLYSVCSVSQLLAKRVFLFFISQKK